MSKLVSLSLVALVSALVSAAMATYYYQMPVYPVAQTGTGGGIFGTIIYLLMMVFFIRILFNTGIDNNGGGGHIHNNNGGGGHIHNNNGGGGHIHDNNRGGGHIHDDGCGC